LLLVYLFVTTIFDGAKPRDLRFSFRLAKPSLRSHPPFVIPGESGISSSADPLLETFFDSLKQK
jgi:hypothetical protein